NLMAVPFDPERLKVTGAPVPVLEGVRTGRTGIGGATYAISPTGFLVYAPAGSQIDPRRTLVWVDRQGHEESLGAPERAYIYPRLSPDGTKVALDVRDQDSDIWVWSLARHTLTKVTSGTAVDRFPVWTPDGLR